MSMGSTPPQQEMNKMNGTLPGNEVKIPKEFKLIALKGLFIIAFFYTLYFARTLILPFTLALLLNFLLRPACFHKLRIGFPMGLTLDVHYSHD